MDEEEAKKKTEPSPAEKSTKAFCDLNEDVLKEATGLTLSLLTMQCLHIKN